MSRIHEITARIEEIPLRHHFATAQDTLARQVSRPVVITLTLENGQAVEAESVPVAYVTGETPESALAAIRAAAPALYGADTTRLRPLLERLLVLLPDQPSARAGLEMALWNAFAWESGVDLWRLWGGSVEEVETDITLALVADSTERAQEAAERGFRRLKMKVGGQDHDAELARVVAVQTVLPEAILRLDANQAFNPAEALDFIRRVVAAGVRLELVEQPVPKEDLAALDAVAAASPVPIFADEAVKCPDDALRLVRETRVHGINVKLMKAGMAGALEIIAIARAAGRRLMIGCMLETRRGIAVSLALACGTGAFEFVDLDSHLLLREEGENPYFTQAGPILRVNRSSLLRDGILP